MFRTLIDASPVIPAVRDPAHVEAAVSAPSRVVYLLCGNVTTVAGIIEPLRSAGKTVLVNIDLLAGLGSDPSAVDYLRLAGADGLISTHGDVLRTARNRKMYAVQRSFLLDSAALANALRALDRFEPDAVELLPAIAAPRAVGPLQHAHPDVTVTAGGLVSTLVEIDGLVRAGVSAISVSEPGLWIA